LNATGLGFITRGLTGVEAPFGLASERLLGCILQMSIELQLARGAAGSAILPSSPLFFALIIVQRLFAPVSGPKSAAL